MTWEYSVKRMYDPDPLDDTLATMGSDGWELAGVIPDAARFATLIFKRPVNNGKIGRPKGSKNKPKLVPPVGGFVGDAGVAVEATS